MQPWDWINTPFIAGISQHPFFWEPAIHWSCLPFLPSHEVAYWPCSAAHGCYGSTTGVWTNILWIMECQVRDILYVHWLLILSGWIRTQLAWGIPGTRGLDHFLRCPHMEWRGQQQPRSRGVFFWESQGKPDGFLVWVSGESLRCWVSPNKGPRRIQTWQAQQKRNGLEWLCRICVS